jgi:hypothetical protein
MIVRISEENNVSLWSDEDPDGNSEADAIEVKAVEVKEQEEEIKLIDQVGEAKYLEVRQKVISSLPHKYKQMKRTSKLREVYIETQIEDLLVKENYI